MINTAYGVIDTGHRSGGTRDGGIDRERITGTGVTQVARQVFDAGGKAVAGVGQGRSRKAPTAAGNRGGTYQCATVINGHNVTCARRATHRAGKSGRLVGRGGAAGDIAVQRSGRRRGC